MEKESQEKNTGEETLDVEKEQAIDHAEENGDDFPFFMDIF